MSTRADDPSFTLGSLAALLDSRPEVRQELLYWQRRIDRVLAGQPTKEAEANSVRSRPIPRATVNCAEGVSASNAIKLRAERKLADIVDEGQRVGRIVEPGHDSLVRTPDKEIRHAFSDEGKRPTLEDLIIRELAATPGAPKPTNSANAAIHAVVSARSAADCLEAAGKTLVAKPFRALIPDRDEPVHVWAILSHVAVYSFDAGEASPRAIIHHQYVTPIEDVRWTTSKRGRPRTWNTDSL